MSGALFAALRRKARFAPPPPPDDPDTIAISTTFLSCLLVQGGTVTRPITLVRGGGYTADVALAVAGLPTGVTGSFSDATLTGGELTSTLTLTATGVAPVVISDPFTVTASGAGVTSSVLSMTVTVTDLSGASRFFRPAQTASELPRGVTPDHDLLFDEATQTLSTVGGSAYAYLWAWDAERVGAARWAARSQTRTVTTTGTVGWADFLAHVAAFVAGTGDWEILVPDSLTMSGMWIVPVVTGNRRLYITFSGALPTTNVMPTLSTLETCSVWTGPTAVVNSLVQVHEGNRAKLTFTGVVFRPRNQCQTGIVEFRNTVAPASVDEVPSEYVFDRCWLDGQLAAQTKRGICACARKLAFLETWVTDVVYPGNEAQGIAGWTGGRYIVLRNVFLEASSIGALWGGADPFNGNTGIYDSQDILFVNVVASKKIGWADGSIVVPLKNGFEAKNVRRWFILNGITFRHRPVAQIWSMLFQNLNDGNNNLLENAVEDVVVHNHDFVDCSNGLNVAGNLAYHYGFATGAQSGTVIQLNSGTNNLVREDDYYNGLQFFVRSGTGVGGADVTVLDYVGATRTFTFDTPLTVDSTTWMWARNGPSTSRPVTRMSFANIRMRNLGKHNAGAGNFGQALQMLGSLGSLLLDQWTVAHDMSLGSTVKAWITGEMKVQGTGPLWLTNFASRALGFFIATSVNSGRTGRTALAESFATYTYDGHSFYGPFSFGSASAHSPGITHYALGGASLADDAAAMGFDTTTGALSGPSVNDGVGGSQPGANLAQLEAAHASMASWAYSR
jgi:hypothetical protein